MTDHSQQYQQAVSICQFLCDEIGQSIVRRLFIAKTDPDDLDSAIARELETSRQFFADGGICENDVEIAVGLIHRAIIAEGLRLVGPIEPVGEPACPN